MTTLRVLMLGAAILAVACGSGSTSSPTAVSPSLVPIAGTWDLEIAPSSICRNTRSQRYIAEVTESSAGIAFQIRSTRTNCDSCSPRDNTSAFSRSGNTLLTTFRFWHAAGGSIPDDQRFSVAISGPGTITPNRVEGSLNGVITHAFLDEDGAPVYTCTAADHRFTMTRR